MRKLFFVTITVIFAAFASLPPAFAGGNPGDENLGRLTDCEVRELIGESPCRRLTREEAFIISKTIEALGNIAGAAIANDRSRYYYHPSPRVRNYNNEGGWLYRGGGRRMGSGDYCNSRLQYDVSSGRDYCVP